MYTVVEQVCEACGEINDHLTVHCPNSEISPLSFGDRLIGWLIVRTPTLMFVLGRMVV